MVYSFYSGDTRGVYSLFTVLVFTACLQCLCLQYCLVCLQLLQPPFTVCLQLLQPPFAAPCTNWHLAQCLASGGHRPGACASTAPHRHKCSFGTAPSTGQSTGGAWGQAQASAATPLPLWHGLVAGAKPQPNTGLETSQMEVSTQINFPLRLTRVQCTF